MKVVLIGGVESSAITLKKLCEYNLEIVEVFGYKPSNIDLVSGYHDLEPICQQHSISFTPFIKINENVKKIQSLDFDFLLVVGLSQLVSKQIIEAPKLGAIGFHPTRLPKGRGRAPVAWLINEIGEGASTFFMLEEEADAGAIVSQEAFEVTVEDNAKSVESKLCKAMRVALDRLIPQMIEGKLSHNVQDDSLSTEFGVRKPEDGLVDWSDSAYQIDRLIKAASEPHPGAFTYCENKRLEIKASNIEERLKIKGVQGRILKIEDGQALVQTGDGLIWILIAHDDNIGLRVGSLLGYKTDLEIYELKRQILELKNLIKELT
ncbi:formyltransferase family protein [uncultured Psychrobacter sp.]|uniref:methionyl-tRNA formyltransferase n=1 Tax=uncultured Psychrobacter sp. TaxID=259303 RepID=UPI00259A1073|nr:formyltransferase family protein [uncultured Psychrobacter sp.]